MFRKLKPCRLLVIEDNPGDYVLLKQLIKRSQLPVEKITHAEKMALVPEIIKDNVFDIVLLDLTLPDSTGIDSVITLQRLLSQTPVVVFSGLSAVEIAIEAISLGAQDYLVKGEFDEKLLAKSIHYSIERNKTQKKLQESNERYEYINKATNDIIWEWDYHTNKGLWGEGFIKTFGYSNDDLLYDDTWIQKFIHPGDREKLKQGLQLHHEKKKQKWQGEFRFRSADGTYKFILDRGYTILDEQGRPHRMIGAMTDITGSREKEEIIRKLYQAVEQTDDIVMITDTDGTITFLNAAFEKTYGYKREEIVGKTTPRILKSGVRDKQFYEELWKNLTAGKSLHCEIINKTKDGRLITIDTSLTPVFNDQQVLIGHMAVQNDITEKKIAEKKLFDAEKLYRTLFEESPDGISIIDAETLLPIEFNKKIHTQLGYSREEFANLKISDYELIDTSEIIKARAEKIMKFGEDNFETKHKTKNGDIRDVQVTLLKITLYGKPVFYTIFRDVTEKTRLEEQLKQQKIDRQRQITEAAISAQEKERNELGRELHDNINQILATIKMYLGMARSKGKVPVDLIVTCHDYITDAIEEIRKLSHSLVAPSLGDIGLHDALQELAQDINISGQFKLCLFYDVDNELAFDEKKKLMIYRIVQEQMNNIQKYASAKEATIRLNADHQYIYLSVTDDGMGFDLNQKTKGIGLRNIQSRVEFYDGAMNIITAPGKGCKLEISIPL